MSALPPGQFFQGSACVSPVRAPCGKVRCRNCKGCREYRLSDYVGRCLAEQATSLRAVAVTLTYGSQHAHADFLVYRDVQLLLKRLRKAEYKVRYIVAGEYGSKKGRSHWHMILFFGSDRREVFGPFLPPETERHVELANSELLNVDGEPVHINPHGTKEEDMKREHWPFWNQGYLQMHGPLRKGEKRRKIPDTIGHCYFQPADRRGFAYLLKYILKDSTGEHRASHFALSKKPVLGFTYLASLARDYAHNGFLPALPIYDIGRKRHWLASSARDAFLRVFASTYISVHGKTPRILPQWCKDYIHKQWPEQDIIKPKFAGFFDDQGQGFRTSQLVVPVEELEVQGPLRPTDAREYRVLQSTLIVVDQDGDKAKTFRGEVTQPFDFREAVGYRRALYEARFSVHRFLKALEGLHTAPHPCECQSCQIRADRARRAGWHVFQTPEPFGPWPKERPEARQRSGPPAYSKAETLRPLPSTSDGEAGESAHKLGRSRQDRGGCIAPAGAPRRPEGSPEGGRALRLLEPIT